MDSAISAVVGRGLGVTLESGLSSENAEFATGGMFDSCKDNSIGRKLLRFDARGVGPVNGGASEVVEGEFEWIGDNPFRASADGKRSSESEGKFDKGSDGHFFSRFWGVMKFLGGESSIEVEGMSTFIEGGP